jgi:hypothetical protein
MRITQHFHLPQRSGLREFGPAYLLKYQPYLHCIIHRKSVGDGRQSLRYLALYMFRVAIGTRRIAKVTKHDDGTGNVVFMVRVGIDLVK